MIARKTASILGLLLFGATTGCVSQDGDDTLEASADAISATYATKLEVRLRPQPRETAIPGTCAPSGEWTVDLEASRIKGEGCIDQALHAVDRTLSDDEVTTIREALNGVHATHRPASCSRHVQVASLQVTYGRSQDTYITQLASCSSTAIPVIPRTLDRLVDVMLELTAGTTAEVLNDEDAAP